MNSRANERAGGAKDLTEAISEILDRNLIVVPSARTLSPMEQGFGPFSCPVTRLNAGARRVDTHQMRSDGRLDPKIIESALAALLHRHPAAPVFAAGPDGLMVEMPGSVALTGHAVVQARSALN